MAGLRSSISLVAFGRIILLMMLHPQVYYAYVVCLRVPSALFYLLHFVWLVKFPDSSRFVGSFH